VRFEETECGRGCDRMLFPLPARDLRLFEPGRGICGSNCVADVGGGPRCCRSAGGHGRTLSVPLISLSSGVLMGVRSPIVACAVWQKPVCM